MAIERGGLICGLLLLAAVAVPRVSPAQQPGARAFDIASVKPSGPDDRLMYRLQPGGRYLATAQTLRILVANAWGIPPDRVAGAEGWRDSERYNIEAKTAAPLPPWPDSNTQLSEMLQSLLKDRFHLAVHRETRQETVYNLTVAKGGSKLQPASDGESPVFGVEKGRIRSVAVPLDLFAGNLSNVAGRMVIDKTGLSGKFDFTLIYAPDDAGPGDNRPSLFTAVEQQLGLRLESAN